MFRLHDTTLEFVSLIRGIEETMPIIPYKEYRHQWMLDMAKAYRKDGSLTKGKNVPDREKNLHTSRCPGIINIKNEGWIVRTHQDIKLTITKHGVDWNTPMNDLQASDQTAELTVGMHTEMAYTDFRKNWPKDWFKSLVKINTPWCVKVPLGYKLLQLHPAHLDNDMFIAMPGAYNDQYGIPKINAVLAFIRLGEFFIPAGTPIAQMILVKDEEIKMTQRGRDEKFMKDYSIHTILSNNTFERSYNQMKQAWHKWMKKKK